MSRLGKWLALSASDRRWLVASILAVTAAEAAIRFLSFSTLLKLLRASSFIVTPAPYEVRAAPQGRIRSSRRRSAGGQFSLDSRFHGNDGKENRSPVLSFLRVRLDARNRRVSAARVQSLARFIRVADSFVPGRRSCLRRSIAAYWLVRRDPRARLYLSARPNRRGLEGHAWVRVGRFEIVPAEGFRSRKPVLIVRGGS